MKNNKLIEIGDYNGDTVYINPSNITQVKNCEIDTYIFTKNMLYRWNRVYYR